jgi:tryptophan halogenase
MSYKICIVGGGSAGWMSAATFVKVFPKFDITLIESPTTKTIGVGESTLQSIRRWIDLLGIDDHKFLKEVGGTFKHSIKFTNFYTENSGSFHYPFGSTIGPDANNWWTKKNILPDTALSDYAECVNPLCLVAENNRFEKNLNYAYHFDATKFGLWLKNNVCKNKVKYIQSNVTDYQGDFIVLDNGKKVYADLFVDCTGFKSQLLGNFLKEEFVSFSDIIPNDSAVATHLNYKDKKTQMYPYTECTAIQNGWVWNIPLWERIGSGYVYSSKYISQEDAEEEFKKYLKTKKFDISECKFNHIKMRIGRYKRFWVDNVVAVGLSAGFIEPLESNGLFTVHENLISLVKILKRGLPNQFSKDIFNSDMRLIFDEFAEFVASHYALSQRQDTQYWEDLFNKKYEIDGEEKNQIYGLKLYSREFFRYGKYNFLDKGFHYISAGMNFNPTISESCNPEEVKKLCDQKNEWKRKVNDLPLMFDYLKRHIYK